MLIHKNFFRGLSLLFVMALLPAAESNNAIAQDNSEKAETDELVSTRNTSRNMKQLGLALHSFHNTYGSFPPNAGYSDDGKPLLSWRVYILPYLDQVSLYEQFHLDEPWNSEHNRKLIERMPEFYIPENAELAAEGNTTLVVPLGESTLFSGRAGIPLKENIDGTSYTIMVVDAPDDAAVAWTQPKDLSVERRNLKKVLFGGRMSFWVTMADGAALRIKDDIDLEKLKALLTRNGREVIDWNQ